MFTPISVCEAIPRVLNLMTLSLRVLRYPKIVDLVSPPRNLLEACWQEMVYAEKAIVAAQLPPHLFFRINYHAFDSFAKLRAIKAVNQTQIYFTIGIRFGVVRSGKPNPNNC